MLSYCAQQSSGSWQWMLDVEHIEKSFLFAGIGARSGLHAGLMAEAGFRGVRNPLDQVGGWMRSKIFTGGDETLSTLLDFRNETELNHTGFKWCPVGVPNQPTVHEILSLLPNINVAQVSKVIVAVPGAADAFRNANMPALNLKCLLSIIMLDGHLDFIAAQSRSRMETDKSVHALMQKIEVVEDASQEALKGAPRIKSARVTAEQNDGKRFEIFVPYGEGHPSHPMTKSNVEEKAVEPMKTHLGETRAKAVVEMVNSIDLLENITDLIKLIAR